ncbi:MAG: hypothetical protein A2519_08930, partial [Candidatus Raymondbacteria bacterium RIFOXYD12_FULL_49_13]
RQLVSVDNFSVAANAITFLFGESGIGKSIIAKALYGLLNPAEFDIAINNQPYRDHLNDPWTRAVRHNSFFVFQEPSSHLNPLMKIKDQLREGSLVSTEHEQLILEQLWEKAPAETIRSITNLFPKPYRPSGGEKQRILLAMAFKKISAYTGKDAATGPALFVFDEPTGSLDNTYRNLFLTMLFNRFHEKKFTALIITHDYSIISEVYGSHRDLSPHVLYHELSRTGDATVAVNDFSPQSYLGWLSSITGAKQDATGGKPLLTIKPDFTIFNKKMRVCGDPVAKTPAPLIIGKGETVYLKAQSGVGKTTLAKIVMGLYKAQNFSMDFMDRIIDHTSPQEVWQQEIWGKKAGLVFQHADEALNLQATVQETFAGLPLRTPLTMQGLKQRLEELFEGEITDAFLSKKVAFLSGGQKQRLNLLRTLILDTSLIILDEPLNGLDFASIKKVLALLEKKRRQGASFLMISHNEEIFDAFVEKTKVYYLTAL